MLPEEALIRKVCQMWSTGLEGTIESYYQHHAPDFHWWNCSRGSIHGRDAAADGVRKMYALLNVGAVKVPIKSVLACDGFVMIERSDDLYRKDGSLIASVPVVGVIEIKDDLITIWRDYCDDWMRDYRFEGAPKSLSTIDGRHPSA